ncbi:MAG: uroporphyrinogen-III synthase [Microbacter sp.]
MLPLVNKIIITTHPVDDDDVLIDQLLKRGANVVAFPMIQITATPNNLLKIKTFQTLNQVQHIIFTSKNGVEAFFDYANQHHYNQLIRSDVQYYVIGKATANALKKRTNEKIYVSKSNTSTEFLNELLQLKELKGVVLLVLGTLAPDTLLNGLSSDKERLVSRVDVYQTTPTRCDSKKISMLITENRYDLITFTSPSAVERFMQCLERENIGHALHIACIGKTTADKAISYGIIPDLIASTPDKSLFVNEITQYLSTHLKQ